MKKKNRRRGRRRRRKKEEEEEEEEETEKEEEKLEKNPSTLRVVCIPKIKPTFFVPKNLSNHDSVVFISCLPRGLCLSQWQMDLTYGPCLTSLNQAASCLTE